MASWGREGERSRPVASTPLARPGGLRLAPQALTRPSAPAEGCPCGSKGGSASGTKRPVQEVLRAADRRRQRGG